MLIHPACALKLCLRHLYSFSARGRRAGIPCLPNEAKRSWVHCSFSIFAFPPSFCLILGFDLLMTKKEGLKTFKSAFKI
jgi:hypothetical protein